MSSPFVPVPVSIRDRTLPGANGKPRRGPQRTSSLNSVSSSSGSSSTRGPGDEILGPGRDPGRRGNRVGGPRSQSSERGCCFTSPPSLLQCQSPVTRARLNGLGLDPTVKYSTSSLTNIDQESPPGPPGSITGSSAWEERPITPTVLGYEVMEERAKLTVYKVLVRKTKNESWVVFRRYTDFSRLNDKLKEMFPGFRLSLPPKRWFKDNYNSDFLEDRQLGLQAFLQNLVAHKDIANCIAVREFLCLDDPPGPFDSLEESRAFCETLEESNYRLQKELVEKQREISSLKKRLEEKDRHIHLLEKRLSGESLTPESQSGLSAQGSDSSVDADGDVESSTAEADQDIMSEENGKCEAHQSLRLSGCWCGPASGSSPPVIEVTQVCDARLKH
ncbi:sorting nexin-16 [Oncorhynchus keta]|uniref:sorting nexin-16 n=1 Tax=Oncorhynchus keta TaxID=8018 RepID=UPI0015F790BB|nr:sorting nexin-16 [Oncorhynchus keta]XP_035597523.1 sorting nexin-16 [Oncorhynchus keta]